MFGCLYKHLYVLSKRCILILSSPWGFTSFGKIGCSQCLGRGKNPKSNDLKISLNRGWTREPVAPRWHWTNYWLRPPLLWFLRFSVKNILLAITCWWWLTIQSRAKGYFKIPLKDWFFNTCRKVRPEGGLSLLNICC